MSLLTLTEETFPDEVASGDVVVLFSASWSDAGSMMRPLFEELAGDFPSWRFGFVDFDDEQNCALSFGVTTIPAVLCFRGGILAWKRTGAIPMATLRGLLGPSQG